MHIRLNCCVAAVLTTLALNTPAIADTYTYTSQTYYYFNTVDNNIADQIVINAAQYPLPGAPALPNGVGDFSVVRGVFAQLTVSLITTSGLLAGGYTAEDIGGIYGVSNHVSFESDSPPQFFNTIELPAFGIEGLLIDQNVAVTLECENFQPCPTENPGPISLSIVLPNDEFVTPLPATLPLLASGLGGLGLLGWRRKQASCG